VYRTTGIVLVTAFALLLGTKATTVSAVSTPSSAIAITSPTLGQSLLATNVQIEGEAPAGVLVKVTIMDTDITTPFVEHLQYGENNGTVTSDQDGHWAYTPQPPLVPSQYSVYATYSSVAQDRTITSNTVAFVATNTGGSSEQLSQITIRQIIIASVIVVLLIISLIIYLVRRHRRRKFGFYDARPGSSESRSSVSQSSRVSQTSEAPTDQSEDPLFMKTAEGRRYQDNQDLKYKSLEAEALLIENELAKTAQELERANTEVVELRKSFSNVRNGTSTTPPPGKPKAKR
jgi:hypothetical protein